MGICIRRSLPYLRIDYAHRDLDQGRSSLRSFSTVVRESIPRQVVPRVPLPPDLYPTPGSLMLKQPFSIPPSSFPALLVTSSGFIKLKSRCTMSPPSLRLPSFIPLAYDGNMTSFSLSAVFLGLRVTSLSAYFPAMYAAFGPNPAK